MLCSRQWGRGRGRGDGGGGWDGDGFRLVLGRRAQCQWPVSVHVCTVEWGWGRVRTGVRSVNVRCAASWSRGMTQPTAACSTETTYCSRRWCPSIIQQTQIFSSSRRLYLPSLLSFSPSLSVFLSDSPGISFFQQLTEKAAFFFSLNSNIDKTGQGFKKVFGHCCSLIFEVYTGCLDLNNGNCCRINAFLLWSDNWL